MHEHFSTFSYNGILLRYYVSPSLSIWLSTHLIILSFEMAFNIFSSTLRTKLGLPHPTTHGLSRCICGHAIDPIGIHLLCCAHRGECTTTHEGRITQTRIKPTSYFLQCLQNNQFFSNDVAHQDQLGKMDEKDVDFEPLIIGILNKCQSCMCILGQQCLSHAFRLPIGQNVCALLSLKCKFN